MLRRGQLDSPPRAPAACPRRAADPVWQFLRREKRGLLSDAIVWNFTKFLVDKEGQVVGRCGGCCWARCGAVWPPRRSCDAWLLTAHVCTHCHSRAQVWLHHDAVPD